MIVEAPRRHTHNTSCIEHNSTTKPMLDTCAVQ